MTSPPQPPVGGSTGRAAALYGRSRCGALRGSSPLRTALKAGLCFYGPAQSGRGPKLKRLGKNPSRGPLWARRKFDLQLCLGFTASRLRSPPSCTRCWSIAEHLGSACSSRPRSCSLRAVTPHISPHTLQQCHASPPASPTVGTRALVFSNGLQFDLCFNSVCFHIEVRPWSLIILNYIFLLICF